MSTPVPSRFSLCDPNGDSFAQRAWMVQSPRGEWVKWDDYERAHTDLALIRNAAAKTPCLGPDDAANVAAWIQGAAHRMEKLAGECDQLRTLVRTLFEQYLDVVEESDEGREFHPVTIGCCRSLWHEPLTRLMGDLRVAAGLPAVVVANANGEESNQ